MGDTIEKKRELYEKLVAMIPELECKGKTMRYTSCNGHMFSYVDKTGSMALRLPAEEREKFLEKYKTTLDEQYGTVMKEYAKIPDDLLAKTNELKKYLEISYEYVKSLKPKAKDK